MQDKIDINKPKKRGRGRPKKQKIEMPKFENDAEFRQYLIDIGLQIVLEMKDQALKKNNIKKPEIARAKTSQYKTVLDAIKTVNNILKDKQIDLLESKFNSFEMGFIDNLDLDAKIEFDKLNDDLETIIKEN